jgi:hypothetical protein
VSFNREGVVIKTPEGWRYCQYAVTWVGSEADGYDPEWDVEYADYFSYIGPPVADHERAMDAWRGPNPGGYTLIPEPTEAELARVAQGEKGEGW